MALKRKFLGFMLVVFVISGGLLLVSGALEIKDAKSLRQIELVARNMAYNADNPTIVLKLGEPVVILVKNNDPGMLHDLVIEGLDVETSAALKYGQSEVLEFTPTKTGRFEYYCSYHFQMMRGEIIVVSDWD
ncbi:MAG: cupredoxin domain-containing protein [candidate division Zixibacteria bacterium]|nr:cupredoxin domain-containing protein [candidate division Zixibacteria bacterium]